MLQAHDREGPASGGTSRFQVCHWQGRVVSELLFSIRGIGVSFSSYVSIQAGGARQQYTRQLDSTIHTLDPFFSHRAIPHAQWWKPSPFYYLCKGENTRHSKV